MCPCLPFISYVRSFFSSSSCNVFISFRGEDTRKGFTSHLFRALRAKKIRAYMDDNMEKGSEIWPTLAEAIERAKLSVIVFSEKYASSSWCLDELVQILECKENKNQIVVPIFYGVDPSHVRKQKGSYTISSKRFKGTKPEVLDKWRRALTKAANLSGWDWSKFRLESKLIEDVVEDLKRKLEDHKRKLEVFEKEEAANMTTEAAANVVTEVAENNKAAKFSRWVSSRTRHIRTFICKVGSCFSRSRCDVFISLRDDEDTRNGFTSDLYHALTTNKISTYMDVKLKKGSEISPTLAKAIKQAKLSVIVFSEKYASSSWCLDELVRILECKEKKKQIVVPIFYGIDPSDVTITFERFEGRKRKVLDKWSKALNEATSLPGWDSSSIRLESQLIDKIVRDVKKKLNVLEEEDVKK